MWCYMKTQSIDVLNIFLIIVSLLLAFELPFELFLFAYAVLGPLHYLTEIRWLHEKNYFVHNKVWMIVFIAITLLMSLNLPFAVPLVATNFTSQQISSIQQKINTFIFPLPLIAFIFSLAIIFVRNWRSMVLALLGSIAISMLLTMYFNGVGVMAGMLLPTLFHVYVFTLLFMVFGTLQSKSKAGLAAIALMCAVPLIIIVSNVSVREFTFGTNTIKTFLDAQFYVVNNYFAGLFGLPSDNRSIFYSTAGIKIQIFIAFAYTYHYLNWFSKTSIIGWAKNISKRSLYLVLALWFMSLALYWYDYRTGLLALFALSLLHVFLELPLNAKSLISLFGLPASKKS